MVMHPKKNLPSTARGKIEKTRGLRETTVPEVELQQVRAILEVTREQRQRRAASMLLTLHSIVFLAYYIVFYRVF